MPFLLLIIGGVVIFVLVKIVQSSSPKGFAKGLAKAQLTSLRAFKKHPNEKDIVKQYRAALLLRPGYTEKIVEAIIKGAKEVSSESGIKFNFQVVVVQLAAYEYTKRTGNSPINVMNDLNLGVTSVIPDSL